ncbi:MAG: DUF3014 domain-containing protein [Acidobacteriota bacterium]
MARQGMSPLVVGLVIVGILACSAFIYYQIVRGLEPTQTPDPVGETPPPPPPPPPPTQLPAIEVPPLDSSDEVIRSLAEGLSDHPQLARWLAPDNLVRRLVAAVANIANDETPRPHIGHLEPPGSFKVAESYGQLIIDPASYARYDRLVEVFSSLDTAAGLRLYHSMKPLFDEAYEELGYPAGDFEPALLKAIDQVLAAPVPAGEIQVKKRVKNYRFADPALERLSPAEKHLLRMGPANAREVKKKLQFLRSALEPG